MGTGIEIGLRNVGKPRIVSEASSSTPAPNANTTDEYCLTALAETATFAIPSGSPNDGQILKIRILDNGTGRTLAWNAIYRAISTTLPTATTADKTIYIGLAYNSADTKWDVLAVANEALDEASYLQNIVEDVTPQLGGDLDVNGHSIISTSNGNVVIAPNGSGVVIITDANLQMGDADLIELGDVQDYTLQWDGSDAVHTVSTGQFRFVGGNIELEDTVDANAGIISKVADRFIHNYHDPVGSGAVPAGSNTFVGVKAGSFNSTASSGVWEGSSNTGVGYTSLSSLTTGYRNTAIGHDALEKCNTGFQNVAIGASCLDALTSGRSNMALGYFAMRGCTTGQDNVAAGVNSLYSITSGLKNVGVGTSAGKFIANGVDPNQTTNNSIYVGYKSKASADGADNEIVIGHEAIGQGANTMVLGGSTLTHVYLANDNQVLGFGAGLTDLEISSDGTDGQIAATTNLDIHPTGVTTLGDGGTTNYSQFDADGALTLKGNARVINHVVIGPTSIKIHGADAAGESVEGLFPTLEFANGSLKEAFASQFVPFRWDVDTDIEVIVDWLADVDASASAVAWNLSYLGRTAGEAVDVAAVTLNQAFTGRTAGLLQRSTFTTKILHGNLAHDDLMGLRIFREADGAGDTLAGTARLLAIHLHFVRNKVGGSV